MVSWSQNDSLFRRFVAEGHAIENVVADHFRLLGFSVDQPEQTVRKHISQASDYANTFDLKIEGVMIEVKGRGPVFTCIQDFPFNAPFVDTVNGWDMKDPKPEIVLCVSQKTGAWIWLPVKRTFDKWLKIKTVDRHRNITDVFYAMTKAAWRPGHELVSALRVVRRRNVLASGPKQGALL